MKKVFTGQKSDFQYIIYRIQNLIVECVFCVSIVGRSTVALCSVLSVQCTAVCSTILNYGIKYCEYYTYTTLRCSAGSCTELRYKVVVSTIPTLHYGAVLVVVLNYGIKYCEYYTYTHTCQLDVRKFRDILLKKAGFH